MQCLGLPTGGHVWIMRKRSHVQLPLGTLPVKQLIFTLACNDRAHVQQQRPKACAALAEAKRIRIK